MCVCVCVTFPTASKKVRDLRNVDFQIHERPSNSDACISWNSPNFISLAYYPRSHPQPIFFYEYYVGFRILMSVGNSCYHGACEKYMVEISRLDLISISSKRCASKRHAFFNPSRIMIFFGTRVTIAVCQGRATFNRRNPFENRYLPGTVLPRDIEKS